METFSPLLDLRVGHRWWPVNSPHKGQWRWALMFSLIYAWVNGWVNYRKSGDLRRPHSHYDVTVMNPSIWTFRLCFQLLLGILQLGWITVYLSDPLTRGYMTASAIYVMTSQVKYLFGLRIDKEFSGPLKLYYVSRPTSGISSLKRKCYHFEKKTKFSSYRVVSDENFVIMTPFLFHLCKLGELQTL